jgi:SAM-dependent methyltransferase
LARTGFKAGQLQWVNAAAKWNERYSTGAVVESQPLPGVLEACRGIPPGIALDVACGTGRHAKALAALGWRVVALDASSVAIEALRRIAAEQALAIDARVQDLEDCAFRLEADSYDLICDCFYLQRSLFGQIRQAVRPGGIFFAALPMVDSAPGIASMNPEFLVRPGELAREFADWEIVQYSEARSRPDARMVAQLTARRPLDNDGR